MIETTFLILAGLMGAAGVIASAAGAHGDPASGLGNAGAMLLFHAAAMLGSVALLGQSQLWRPMAIAAIAGWSVGGALFAGDIVLRAATGNRLFPMAAPTGGTLLILAWVALAIAAFGARGAR